MSWLNYHHLLYFWTAAREGSITKACEVLHLTQPTVSGQIRELEKSLKSRLFERSGRSIRLTEAGQIAYRYADEIFTLGRELQEALAGRPAGLSLRVVVGVADTLSKLLVQLAAHEIDMVLSDFPANPRVGLKAFNHLLGDCGVTVFGANALARRYRAGFPRSLDGAPMLLPSGNTALRRSLEQWFDEIGVRPQVRAEFTDSALLKAFGSFGDGLFVAPTAVEDDIKRMYGVGVVGREESVRERVYAISIEKRLKNPTVVAISKAARRTLEHD